MHCTSLSLSIESLYMHSSRMRSFQGLKMCCIITLRIRTTCGSILVGVHPKTKAKNVGAISFATSATRCMSADHALHNNPIILLAAVTTSEAMVVHCNAIIFSYMEAFSQFLTPWSMQDALILECQQKIHGWQQQCHDLQAAQNSALNHGIA